jgi:nucleoside-diphosphate-sugar epimerase
MAIPTFLRRAGYGETLPLIGSPDSFRDYTYIRDALRGIFLVAAASNLTGPVNIASGRPVRLRDLIDVVGRAVGVRPKLRWLPTHPLDVYGTHADIKMARRIGYSPQVSMLDGIEEMLRAIPGRSSQPPSFTWREPELNPEEKGG